MLRSVGKQSGGIRGVSPEEEKEGYGGKDLRKRKVLSPGHSTVSDASLICRTEPTNKKTDNTKN